MPEFAPGLPKKGKKTSIPRAQNSEWDLNIQAHQADRAGFHYDIRLSPPGSSIAYSWATKKLPDSGVKTTAARTDDHSRGYMGWSGKIEEGYGKGTVRSIADEKVDILKASDHKIEFNRHEGNTTKRYILLRKPGSDNWLFYNYTPNKESKIYKDVPSYKKSYKSINFRDLDPEKDSDNEVWSPKLDGAHNLIVLRPDKRPDVFSYRKSKRSDDLIDHTFKTDLWKKKSPKKLGKTVLRAEVYMPGEKGNETSRVLNSSVPKARELQKKKRPLDLRIFDVVKFKGKNVEDKPFKEKLEMLREVNKNFNELKLPPLAISRQEKKNLLKELEAGSNPLTQEGLVIYKKDQNLPIKVKKKKDFDVQITGTYPATPGSKYEGKGVGGFTGIPEGSQTEIKFGSGLDDKTRKEAFRNPQKFIGEWAKVQAQHKHRSGKFQAPIFKEIRSEKMEKKAAVNWNKVKKYFPGEEISDVIKNPKAKFNLDEDTANFPGVIKITDPEEAEKIQKLYENSNKTGYVGNLKDHILRGNGLVWKRGEDGYLVGQPSPISDKVFALSHIAPSSKKSSVNLMLDALETEMPLGMAVPERIAKPAERLGFKRLGKTKQEFGGEEIDKTVLGNKAVVKKVMEKKASETKATPKDYIVAGGLVPAKWILTDKVLGMKKTTFNPMDYAKKLKEFPQTFKKAPAKITAGLAGVGALTWAGHGAGKRISNDIKEYFREKRSHLKIIKEAEDIKTIKPKLVKKLSSKEKSELNKLVTLIKPIQKERIRKLKKSVDKGKSTQ